MVKRSFKKKGLTVHFDKSIHGEYFINGHYPTKIPPEGKTARMKFYKKGKLLKNLKRVDANNRKYKTIKALKKSV